MWQPPPTSQSSAVVWPWLGRPFFYQSFFCDSFFIIKFVEPHVPHMHLLHQVVASVKILVQVAASLKRFLFFLHPQCHFAWKLVETGQRPPPDAEK
jgi:hypothetical protein